MKKLGTLFGADLLLDTHSVDVAKKAEKVLEDRFAGDKGRWLIWSNEHKAWWGTGHRGYVKMRVDAGRYTYAEAVVIVEAANLVHMDGEPYEAMVQDV